MWLAPRSKVDRYVVERQLGAGGMAEVYLVRHVTLGSRFALKLLTHGSPTVRQRLLQEGRVQSALRHPNVLPVLDVVEVAGQSALVMAYVDGPSLDRALRAGRLEPDAIDALVRGILKGVAAAHRAGFVHRDLKPDNVLLSLEDGEIVPKVADFGLVKALRAAEAGSLQTRAGTGFGTPAYMAPEQLRDSSDVGPSADVFSLGVLLYELCAGHRPFQGPDLVSLGTQIAEGRYPPLTGVPEAVVRVVDAALSPDPGRRPPDADALLAAWSATAFGGSRPVWPPWLLALFHAPPPDVPALGETTAGETAPPGGETTAPPTTAPSLDSTPRPAPASPSREFDAQTRLVALVCAELVDRPELSDRAAAERVHHHEQRAREALGEIGEGEGLEVLGAVVRVGFSRASVAVRYALRLAGSAADGARASVHLGDVVLTTSGRGTRLDPAVAYGGRVVAEASRLLALAVPGQVLTSRPAFDAARQQISGDGPAEVSWIAHGPYLFAGVPEPFDVCEVATGAGRAPPDGPVAARHDPRAEVVVGWRPSSGGEIPRTRFRLDRKLGEGAVGEVWLAHHAVLRDRRVFKFCFQAERVRSLQRELVLFRILRDRVGAHPHIVGLQEVSLEEPPFYLVVDHVDGTDLAGWFTPEAPLAERLEVVAQIADGLQAAHEAGVVHRDVKPGNILVSRTAAGPHARLSDFGIGQVLTEDALGDLTRDGAGTLVASSGSGGLSGTTLYVAPELLAGEPASPRSDLYALGVVLYQLVVGDLRRPLPTDWAGSIDDPLLREDLAGCFAGAPRDRFVATGELAARLRTLPARRAAREQAELARADGERRAYRRGQARAVAVASVVGVALAGLALVAWRGWQAADLARADAVEASARARRELANHYFAAGFVQQDLGDPLAALPWFARLLEEVAGGPREENARTRLAAITDAAPRLLALWQSVGASAVGLSPDGERAVTMGQAVPFKVFRLGDASPIFEGPTGEEWISSLAVAPDGRRVAWSAVAEVGVSELATGAIVARHPAGAFAGRTRWRFVSPEVAVLPRACREPPIALDLVAGTFTAGSGTATCWWDPTTGRTLVREGGTTVVARPEGGEVQLPRASPVFDVGRGGRVALGLGTLLQLHEPDGVAASPIVTRGTSARVDFDPTGHVIVAVAEGGIQPYDADTQLPLGLPLHTAGGVVDLAFDASGRRLAVLTSNGLVHLWELPVDPAIELDVASNRLLPGGRVVYGIQRSGNSAFWDRLTGQRLREGGRGWGGPSADGAYFAWVGEELVLADLSHPDAPLVRLPRGVVNAANFAWSRSGHDYALDSPDGLFLRSASDPGRTVGPLRTGLTFGVDWSFDGQHVLLRHGTFPPAPDPTGPLVSVYETTTGAHLSTFTGSEARFTADGAILVALEVEGRWVFLRYDLEGRRLPGPELAAAVSEIVASPIAGRFVGRDVDGVLRLHDGGVEVGRVRSPSRDYRYLEGGERILTGFQTDGPTVWDARTGERIATLSRRWGIWEDDGYLVRVPSLRADARPVADWIRTAELLSGRHLEGAELENLLAEEVLERWTDLVARYPGVLGPTAARP